MNEGSLVYTRRQNRIMSRRNIYRIIVIKDFKSMKHILTSICYSLTNQSHADISYLLPSFLAVNFETIVRLWSTLCSETKKCAAKTTRFSFCLFVVLLHPPNCRCFLKTSSSLVRYGFTFWKTIFNMLK